MNQILVTEKIYVTPELKRKKKVYKSLFILSVRLFSFPSILTSKYILIAIGNPTLATRVCKLESMVYKTKS